MIGLPSCTVTVHDDDDVDDRSTIKTIVWNDTTLELHHDDRIIATYNIDQVRNSTLCAPLCTFASNGTLHHTTTRMLNGVTLPIRTSVVKYVNMPDQLIAVTTEGNIIVDGFTLDLDGTDTHGVLSSWISKQNTDRFTPEHIDVFQAYTDDRTYIQGLGHGRIAVIRYTDNVVTLYLYQNGVLSVSSLYTLHSSATYKTRQTNVTFDDDKNINVHIADSSSGFVRHVKFDAHDITSSLIHTPIQ